MEKTKDTMTTRHYWEIKYDHNDLDKEKFREFTEYVEHLLRVTTIPTADWEGAGESEIDQNYISLNGYGEDACETLRIDRLQAIAGLKSIYKWKYSCNTHNRPYNEVVTAILLVFKHVFKDQVMLSSESSHYKWGDGYRLAQQVIEDIEGPHYTVTQEVTK